MNSDEINDIIQEIDDQSPETQHIYASCIGGKIIPYIGWLWRAINFDRDHCWLGILPMYDSDPIDQNDSIKVGFMGNNKWHYDEFKVEGDEWKTLKELIIVAVEGKRPYYFETVDVYMQSLLPEKYK